MERYRDLIAARIDAWCKALPDDGLYEPMSYLLRLPAKRVRPSLVLSACEMFGGRAEDALDEALGIELFHNFTLMHDDIMDASPVRRGQATVHARWDINAAILSGDAMLVKAYQLIARRAEVLDLFSRCALQVCEGQQMDMEFERRDRVSVLEYMEMIRLKTAVLLSCALRTGAMVAEAPTADRDLLGQVGQHLGVAFQLRDDLLDAFGDPELTGKQLGGDLRAGKKTWMLIRGMERSEEVRSGVLQEELAKGPGRSDVPRMLEELASLGVQDAAEEEILHHERAANEALDAIAIDEERKAPLRDLAASLMDRTY